MVTNSGQTGGVKRSTEKKIKELTELLMRAPKGSSKVGTTQGSDFLNSSSLASSLFGRAPAEFLEQKEVHDLVTITERSLALLSKFLKSQSKTCVEIDTNSSCVSVFVVLADRPFIINTITEAVRETGSDIRAFLHPIIKGESGAISLCYLEIDLVPSAQLATLKASLEQSLLDLLLVTDDFTAMLVRTDTIARVLDTAPGSIPISQGERREIVEFIRFLTDGGYIFIGHAEWRIGKNGTVGEKPTTALGVFKSEGTYISALLAETKEDVARALEEQRVVHVVKLRTRSLVHRRTSLLHVLIQEFSADGSLLAVHSLIGMLTSKAKAQESFSVPFIRRKIQSLLDHEDALPNSYTYKKIVNLIDHMPKDDALRLEVPALLDVVNKMLALHSRRGTKVAILADAAKRGVTVLVVMPRDRFNTSTRRTIQKRVESAFGALPGSAEYLLDVSDKALARFYFSVPTSPEWLPLVNLDSFESELAGLSKTWRDRFEEVVIHTDGDSSKAAALWAKYSDAFGEDYQAVESPQDALLDVGRIESLSDKNPLHIGLATPADGQLRTVVLYSRDNPITVSRALPVFENSGFEVLNERSAACTPAAANRIFIHRFLVRPRAGLSIDLGFFEKVVGPGLTQVFLGNAANDPLNQLMLAANLDIRSISLLRTYAGFLAQINKFATRHAIYHALAGTAASAKKLWEMFEVKFNPASKLPTDARLTQFAKLREDYQDILAKVSDLSQDRILRGLGILLENTLRTNFYTSSPSIALKLHSENTEILPQPRPKYEIYVSSPVVEGIHLRSAMIARGGLRWSDRKDDYRTEVLGLMKTQKIKNVVIVPSGAKGGFIVRQLPEDPSQVKGAVENAYREFIRALLSVTDNRVAGVVVHPKDLVIYDGEDPYFVVAADKGTSTFSDIANEIATSEYHLWLGDAFASGGSVGYDHKKYAITAKGAWECVMRHFKEAGIEFESKPFTAIGIGDMSGDVFGNGLLLSNQVKLVAAFDHRSIFIDPNPDTAKSFAERKRLFEMKGSRWEDYKKDVISKGGGVWSRFEKEIKLTNEARAALSLAEDAPPAMNGEQLISYILKAKVDLLWNGGIGTYVKSSQESNSEVNDSTNDRVRINADELRAAVVGEGGNLGFTALARHEFARAGGHINTDAIDNSGGVDLSDHEVNLKILFARLIADGKMKIAERNELLKEIAPEVIEAVLDHNRSHALMLTLGVIRSSRNLEYIKSLIKELSKVGYLNRALESLPDDEELQDRKVRKEGLSRPELSVLVALVKMWTKDKLLPSRLLQDPVLEKYLLNYFPSKIKERFKDEALTHPLAKNIIATQISNYTVDRAGVSFFHRVCENQGAEPVHVIKCTLAADILLGLEELRAKLTKFDTVTGNDAYIACHQDLTRTLRAAAGWLVSSHPGTATLSELIELYSGAYQTVALSDGGLLGKHEVSVIEDGIARYTKFGLDRESAQLMSSFKLVIPILEMLSTARISGEAVTKVAPVYSQMLETLGVQGLVTLGLPIDTQNRWENELRINSYEEIRRALSAIACGLLAAKVFDRKQVDAKLRQSPSFNQLSTTMEEVEGDASPAALSVIAKQLRILGMNG